MTNFCEVIKEKQQKIIFASVDEDFTEMEFWEDIDILEEIEDKYFGIVDISID